MTTTPHEGNDRLAVLIDADNADSAIIEGLLAEVARQGVASVKRIVGQVPSPTPTIGTSGASITVISSGPAFARREQASIDAASHPAVPPPRMTTLSTFCVIGNVPKPLAVVRHAKEPRPKRRGSLAVRRTGGGRA